LSPECGRKSEKRKRYINQVDSDEKFAIVRTEWDVVWQPDDRAQQDQGNNQAMDIEIQQ